jgi:predicted transcriptional regulator
MTHASISNISKRVNFTMDDVDVTQHNVQRVVHIMKEKGYTSVPIVLAKDATVVSAVYP